MRFSVDLALKKGLRINLRVPVGQLVQDVFDFSVDGIVVQLPAFMTESLGGERPI